MYIYIHISRLDWPYQQVRRILSICLKNSLLLRPLRLLPGRGVKQNLWQLQTPKGWCDDDFFVISLQRSNE